MDPLKEEAREEAVARMVLLRLPGVGDVAGIRLVQAFGSAVEALAASPKAFAAVAGHAAAAARRDRELVARVRRGLAWCRKAGVEVRLRGEPGYPPRLEALADPPAVVLLRGRHILAGRPGVAVVGSRASTSYGRRVADAIGRLLAERGLVTVSGLALGIDAAAHRGALEAGGTTTAVLGTGPDVPHPPSNRRLFEAIARKGLLVTEFLPGEPARAHHFPRRNRVLAALADAVVVVEAARRSGALITVRHALDLGRPVGAVPGSIYGTRSQGTNGLLKDGAHVLTEPEDVLAMLPDPLRRSLEDPSDDQDGPVLPADADQARLWPLLEGDPRSVDELTTAAALPARRVLVALAALEIEGRVRREGGMRFRRTR